MSNVQDPLADLSASDIELGVHAALEARDMPAVVGLLRLLTAKDPHRAQAVLDIVNIARLIRKDEENR